MVTTIQELLMMGGQKVPAYYIDATNGNDANPGKSPGQAWQTIAKVNAATFLPGNRVLFKRGETWNEQLSAPSSGIAGKPVIFGAYGSGNKPIIDVSGSVPGWATAGNWTNTSGNIWMLTWANIPTSPSFMRLWLDGTEVPENGNATVTATYPFFVNIGSSYLYIYSVGNPATSFSSMVASAVNNTVHYPATTNTKDYITFDGIEFRGGTAVMYLYASSHITIQNCTAGLKSAHGIYLFSDMPGGLHPTDYIDIHNNIIESGWSDAAYISPGLNDGIRLCDAVNYASIYNNTISNWGLMCVDLDSAAYGTVSYNDIHHNILTSPNERKCGGFEINGTDVNHGAYNTIHHNLFTTLSQKSILNGDHNSVYYNIFFEVRNKATTSSRGLSLEGASYVCYNNKIYNNTIYNTDDVGVFLTTGAGYFVKHDNEVINNLLVNDGLASSPEQSLNVANGTANGDIGANIYKNNLVYKSGTTNIIRYWGSQMSAATFNIQIGHGDTISGNLQADPLFVSGTNLHLQIGSPAIGAGIGVGLTVDYDGVTVPASPAIGAYEYV